MLRFKWKWLLLVLVPLAIGFPMANMNSWRPRRVRVWGSPAQVAFSSDGSHVALRSLSNGGGAGRVEVWRVIAPSRFRQPSVKEHLTFAVDSPGSICFSGDSTMLICTEGEVTRRWNLKTHKALKPLPGGGGFAQPWPHTDSVVATGNDGWQQRSVRSGQVQKQLDLSKLKEGDDTRAPSLFAFAPDGQTTAWSIESKAVIVLCDTQTQKRQRLTTLFPKASDNLQCSITALTFSPDSRFLAVAWSADVYDAKGNDTVSARVTMWDLKKHKVAAKWMEGGQNQGIGVHAFSPDNALLAAAREDGAVSLRDAHTGKLHRLLKTAGTSVSSVAFSPDGRTLASCGSDGALYLWRVE